MMSERYARASRHRHGARPARQRRARRWRTPLIVAASALVTAFIVVATLSATGAFRQPVMIVHGTEHVVVNSLGGMTTTRAFPDISNGSPVRVVNSSGTVIGTGTLAPSDPSSWGSQDAVYSFTVTVPAGEPRYGIEIGRGRGTVWLTGAQMRRGPALSVTR